MVKTQSLTLGSHPALRTDLKGLEWITILNNFKVNQVYFNHCFSSTLTDPLVTNFFLFFFSFFVRRKWMFPDERTLPSESVLQHQRQLSMLAFLVPSTVPSSRRRVSRAEHSRTCTDDLRVWSLTNGSDSFVRAQILLSFPLVQLEFVHFIAVWLVGWWRHFQIPVRFLVLHCFSAVTAVT